MARKSGIACVVFVAAWVSASAGGQPTSRPAGKVPPATRPAVDPAARKILDSLEKAGDQYPTVAADINYRVDDRMTRDTETRTGAVKYRKETKKKPAKFYIRFDTLRQGKGRPIKDKIEYGFDGLWLTEAKHRLKQMTRYQVAAKGEKFDPFRLGKGPFPVPFGQKTDDIVKYFEARTRPPRDKDPNSTDYVRLTTRAKYKQEISFLSLEMWIGRKTRLPVRIRSRDKNRKITTVVFSHIKTGVKMPDAVFHMKRPRGWEYKVERLKGKKRLKP